MLTWGLGGGGKPQGYQEETFWQMGSMGEMLLVGLELLVDHITLF